MCIFQDYRVSLYQPKCSDFRILHRSKNYCSCFHSRGTFNLIISNYKETHDGRLLKDYASFWFIKAASNYPKTKTKMIVQNLVFKTEEYFLYKNVCVREMWRIFEFPKMIDREDWWRFRENWWDATVKSLWSLKKKFRQRFKIFKSFFRWQ